MYRRKLFLFPTLTQKMTWISRFYLLLSQAMKSHELIPASSLASGDKVRLAFVPSAVTNVECGATGTVASAPTTIAGQEQVKVKLDDGRVITWNIEWLERIGEKVPSPPCQSLPIESIRLDGGTQPRINLNHETVREYAHDMEQGATFPPVIVYNDGDNLWLADGFHRLAAARTLGLTEIAAEVRQGTRRDAVLFSCGVNAQHGLRRSNEDKRRAVLTLLRDEEWSQFSNNKISKLCGVSLDLVNRLRRSLNDSLSENPTRRYTTKHGTTATMNTAHIGRANPAPNAPFTNKDQELRQQAKRLGLSYSRVKDQVLPDVKRNHHNPTDIDDRPGAMPPSPINPNSLLAAFLANLDCLSEAELEAIGQALAATETRKAIALIKGMATSKELAEAALAVLSGNLPRT
jgi:hypothetical protein